MPATNRAAAGLSIDIAGRKRLRRSFQPACLRLLFIGESPPASGRFFYRGDSGLYRAMRDAFRAADPSIGDGNFLAAFQSLGCYLVDLCPEPVDHLVSKSRRACCEACEESLSLTIARLQPAMIATLLRSIERNVAQAAARGKWSGPVLHFPYPGRWILQKEIFIETLAPVIRALMKENG